MMVFACHALGFLGGCRSDPLVTCRNSAVLETPSPGAELKAVVFTRDCGATTGTGTHVSILPNRAPLRLGPAADLMSSWTGSAAIACASDTIPVHASSKQKNWLRGLESNIRLRPGMTIKAGPSQEELCLRSPKHLRIPM
jgi:hypothetical protein